MSKVPLAMGDEEVNPKDENLRVSVLLLHLKLQLACGRRTGEARGVTDVGSSAT